MRTRRGIQMVTTEGEVEQPYSPSNPPPCGSSGREILAVRDSVSIIDGEAVFIPLSRSSERVIFILCVNGVTPGGALYLQYMLDGSPQGTEVGLGDHYFDIATADGNVLTIRIMFDPTGAIVFEPLNFGVAHGSCIVYSD